MSNLSRYPAGAGRRQELINISPYAKVTIFSDKKKAHAGSNASMGRELRLGER
jgi:hypothetical protein